MIEKKRILGILCALMSAGLLFVGLWPFDPSPQNRAYWLPDEEGLHFDGQDRRLKLSVGGIAYTPLPLSSPEPAPSEQGSFTVEILLKPTQNSPKGVPHILSFIDRSGKDVFYLGQWKQSLIVRWYTLDQSGRRRMKEIGAREVLIEGKTQRLTVVSKRASCSLFVNGEQTKSFQGISLLGGKESIRGLSVTLGNSRNVKNPWTGTVQALKVHERALSEREIAKGGGAAAGSVSPEGLIAAFALEKSHSTVVPDLSGNGNALAVPERVTLQNSILAWPDWRNQKDSSPAEDIAVNILGFVPFGFFFAFWRERGHGSGRWPGFLAAVLIGAAISLSIEVTQAFIPARDSNMVDLLCNTGGTVLGAGLKCHFEGREKSNASEQSKDLSLWSR